MGFFKERLSFDFGSSELRIVKNGRVVIQEESKVEISNNNDQFAFGNDILKTESKRIIYPIQRGVIADFNGFEMLLRNSIKKVPDYKKHILPPSLVTLALVPESSTEIELRAVRDVLEHAGSRSTFMIYSTHALIKGIGLKTNGTYLIIDAGAGKISLTVFSSDKIHYASKLYFGAVKLKEIISLFIKQNYNAECTNAVLEEILKDYVSALNEPKTKKKKVSTANDNGFIELDLLELNKMLNTYFQQLDNELLMVLHAFKHKSDKNIEKVILTGGLSKLNELERRISQLTNLPCENYSDKDYILQGLQILDADFEKNPKTLR